MKTFFDNLKFSRSLTQSIFLNLFKNTVFAFIFFFLIITITFASDRDFYVNAFKDPASPVMEGIIDFHHDVFFFLIVILIFVSWFLIRILAYNLISDNIVITNVSVLSKPVQIQSLEFIWTLIPTLILFAIAGPSFTLLYAMNELLVPSITVKVIGNQ
jgi:cytochrome c oxidase subunit 2